MYRRSLKVIHCVVHLRKTYALHKIRDAYTNYIAIYVTMYVCINLPEIVTHVFIKFKDLAHIIM